MISSDPMSDVAAALRRSDSRADAAGDLHRLALTVHESDDEAAAIRTMRRAAGAVGAEASLVTLKTRHDADHTSYRSVCACDCRAAREWCDANLIGSHPWLLYACSQTQAARSCEIDVLRQDPPGAMARYGFRSALVVPAHSAHGPSQVTVLCVGSAVDGYFNDDSVARLFPPLRAFAMELHDWLVAKVRSQLVAQARLTQLDMALLRFEAQGHGSKEIARALGTSPITIDCRFQRLNARIGVANRRDAVRLVKLFGVL